RPASRLGLEFTCVSRIPMPIARSELQNFTASQGDGRIARLAAATNCLSHVARGGALSASSTRYGDTRGTIVPAFRFAQCGLPRCIDFRIASVGGQERTHRNSNHMNDVRLGW